MEEVSDLAQNCFLWRMMLTYGTMQSLNVRNDDDDGKYCLYFRVSSVKN